jgi:Tfp pilus assembly protein PilX
MLNKQPLNLPGSQSGAALLVSLLMLTTLTLLGIAAIKSSTIEQRIANNLQQKMLSMAAAEAALRQAESEIDSFANANALVSFSGNGRYALISSSQPFVKVSTLPAHFDLAKANHWLHASFLPLSKRYENFSFNDLVDSDRDYKKPRYIIEYIGRYGSIPETTGVIDARPYAFRLTAAGWGAAGNMTTILRSYLLKNLQPDLNNHVNILAKATDDTQFIANEALDTGQQPQAEFPQYNRAQRTSWTILN